MNISQINLEEFLGCLEDPNFDITMHNYQAINDAKHIWDSQENELTSAIVETLLLRLRKESPHVFAISVGQFCGFDGIEDYWKENGFVDTKGFTWLVPSITH